MRNDDVLIFPEHCPNHGAPAWHYWVESVDDGYDVPYIVTVQYKCRTGCLETQSAAKEPREVRDYANHRILKTAIPKRIYPGDERS